MDRIDSENGIHELNRQILALKSREAAEAEAKLLEGLQDPRSALHESVLQVFFPAAQDYNENDSVRFPIRFDEWRTISVAVPNGPRNLPIRIDPASEPCLIQIADVTLRRPNGTVLWQMNGGNAHELQIGGTSTCLWRGDIVGIASTGHDPQFRLPLLATSGDVLLELRVKLVAGIQHMAEVFSTCLRLFTDGR
jgi:hypothetical protein